MKTLIAITALVCALAGTAAAQDEPLDEPSTDTAATTDTSTDTSASTSSAAATTSAPAGAPGTYPMAIQAELNVVTRLPFVHGLYNLGGNYLDTGVGFNVAHTSPETGSSETVFAVNMALGYRMYQALSARIHPYLEPYLLLSLSTDDDDNDPVTFGGGGALGVDFQLFDQFTLGTSLGAELTYRITDQDDVLAFGLYTGQINATFWW